MSARTTLLRSLLQTRWPGALVLAGAGCGAGPLNTNGEACLEVPLDADCPDEETARQELVGRWVGSCPMMEVKAVGELVSRNERTFAEGGWDSGDTGEVVTYQAIECCYAANLEDQGICDGRPVRDQGRVLLASAASVPGWSGGEAPDLSGLSDEERRLLAEFWVGQGLMEHSSVAGFARLALDLLALGAPADLLRRAQQAGADEVDHAEACFALASALSGESVAPGPLSVPGRAAPVTLEELVRETLLEGCIGETLAVVAAMERLSVARDPAVRRLQERIVADETRHAELAWDIVEWASAQLPEATARRLLAEADQHQPGAPAGVAGGSRALEAFGLVGSARLGASVAAGMREVVRPVLWA